MPHTQFCFLIPPTVEEADARRLREKNRSSLEGSAGQSPFSSESENEEGSGEEREARRSIRRPRKDLQAGSLDFVMKTVRERASQLLANKLQSFHSVSSGA